MNYDFDWVGPTSPLAWSNVQLRQAEPYGDHLRPLYNLQEDIGTDEARDRASGSASDPATAADDNGHERWLQLATSLQSRVERFALVAAQGDRLTGCLRFFPKPLSTPRAGAWTLAQHRADNNADILWIGAASVDLAGFETGLPAMMMMMLFEEARRRGFTRMQALAWSDVPVYALWAQAFPWSVYEEAGFHSIADTGVADVGDRRPRALPDMLAGHHGGYVQELVTTQLARAVLTPERAEQFAIVERTLI